eukprot:g9050.t1
MAEGRDIDDTEPLRIAELFLVFIVVSLLFGRLMKFLDHRMHGLTKRGLRHTVHHIQEELLALGVISLLLIVSEDYLLRICVHNDDYKSEYNEADSSYDTNDKDSGHRRLLAGGDSECSDSDEPFWSAQTIHQTHIFIFLIAIVHVLYATVSFLLCSWRLHRWKRYDQSASLRSKTLEGSRMMYGRNAFEYWFWSFWAQFSPAVDELLYVAMRHQFLERMDLHDDFVFHTFLQTTMVDEFAIVVHTDWQMWVVAAIWILVPKLLLVTTILSVLIVLLVGTKLELVGVKLSQQAYLSYGTRGEGLIQPQSISGPGTLFMKPIEIISNKLGMSSTTIKTEDSGPKLATKSMTVAPQKDIEVSNEIVRRAHSFEEKDGGGGSIRDSVRPALAPISQHHEVRFDIGPEKSDPDPEHEYHTRSFEERSHQSGSLPRSFSTNYRLPDAATFFWFGKPQLILRALQFVYFETAMAIAVVLFDLWQSSNFILEDTVILGNKYILVAILIVVGVICLLQTSFLVLPTYVLTAVVGSHCPEQVLEQARKLNNLTSGNGGGAKTEHLRNEKVLHRLETLVKKPPQHQSPETGSSSASAMLVEAVHQDQTKKTSYQGSLGAYDPSTSEDVNRDPSERMVENPDDEEDEEMQAIVLAFGSFQNFLESIQASQNAIKATCPAATFNFDCFTGTYKGQQSTSFDAAAINLTLDLNDAQKTLHKHSR